MALRNYSASALATTTTSAITSTAQTTFTVASVTGFPATPFIGRLNADTSSEEIVLVTNVSGTTLTVTRGYDSTPAQASHTSGVSFRHSVSAIDLREPNAHVNASSGVHGISGSVVGTTDAQILSSKTLTAPTINAVTFSGAATGSLSGLTLTSPGVTGGTFTSPTIATGTLTSPTISTGTATSITLLTPTITTPTSTNGTWTGGTVNPNTLQVSGVAVPTTSSTDTLTNKSIDLGTNTVTGTKAQFNTALTGDDFATLAGAETLTSKTLTSPTITTPTINGSGGALTLPAGPDTVMGVGANFGAWTAGTVAGSGTGWTGYTWYYRYLTVGKTIFFSARMQLTGAGGTAGLTLPAPFTAFTWPSGTHRYVGTGAILSNGASNLFTCHPYMNSGSSTIAILLPGLLVNNSANPNAVTTGVNKVVLDNWQSFTAAVFTAETSYTLASGDQIYVNLVVETA